MATRSVALLQLASARVCLLLHLGALPPPKVPPALERLMLCPTILKAPAPSRTSRTALPNLPHSRTSRAHEPPAFPNLRLSRASRSPPPDDLTYAAACHQTAAQRSHCILPPKPLHPTPYTLHHTLKPEP